MLITKCLPHDRLEYRVDEIGSPEELAALPWAVGGIARFAPTRLGIELRIGPYVGRLVIPDRAVIDIVEPYPGTVAACVELSRTGRRSGDQVSPPARVVISPWSALVEAFVEELSGYVMRGIERHYSSDLSRTSRPRGRIDVTHTVTSLFSRGRTDQVICQPRDITDDGPLNRVIVAAASRAEQVLMRESQKYLLQQLRITSPALSGVRRDALPDFASARMSVNQDRTDHARLLSLSEFLLRGIPAMPTSERFDAAYPMTAWLNVEQMFEEAIRSVTKSIVGSRGKVHAGSSDSVQLFKVRAEGESEPLVKSVDPDVVIRCGDRVVLLDAKYRRHSKEFTEDELYQLMAHAGAYQAAAAALVAPCRPGLAPGERWLGSDKNGTSYYVITVDPTSSENIYSGVAHWLEHHVTRQ